MPVKSDQDTDRAKKHLGHLFLEHMKGKRQDEICHIDAGTGEQTTYGWVLSQSIQAARCLRKLGVQPGDVMALRARNHIQMCIPYYAAIMNGITILTVSRLNTVAKNKSLISKIKPKIVFCDDECYDNVSAAAESEIQLPVVSFGSKGYSFSKFMAICDTDEPTDFKVADFDIDKIFVWLVQSSGSMREPKLAAFKHRDVIEPIFFTLRFLGNIEEPKLLFSLSSINWISGMRFSFVVPFTSFCLLTTSKPDDIGHYIDVIHKYRPSAIKTMPPTLWLMMKHEKKCDLTCFDIISLGGAKIHKELVKELRMRVREDTVLKANFGMTEAVGTVVASREDSPEGSFAPALHKLKIIDLDTGKEIREPYKTGELWANGPRLSEFYKDPEATAQVITGDGWLKTGDLFYKDENENYYFVERLKLLILYQSYKIHPSEIEEELLSHSGVLEVGVTCIDHVYDGEHPVAGVVRRPGCDVTAQELKDLVAGKLHHSSQLRGGVVFLDKLPKTANGKIARAMLKQLLSSAERE